LDAFLFYKGFHALESYRVAHWLWQQGRKAMGLFLQSRISQLFSVDVHPAAQIGRGIMFDHGTGIVIGETGGGGRRCLHHAGRHPWRHRQRKRRPSSQRSAGACCCPWAPRFWGNIEVGEYSRVGAGSVVLQADPAPLHRGRRAAKLVNCDCGENPSQEMDHYIEELPDNTG
jgi:serine O-acetyltransferase